MLLPRPWVFPPTRSHDNGVQYLGSSSIIKIKIGIMFFCTFRTNTVAKFGAGVFMNIGFDLIPIPLIVSNLFAVGADWDNASQHFYLFLVSFY